MGTQKMCFEIGIVKAYVLEEICGLVRNPDRVFGYFWQNNVAGQKESCQNCAEKIWPQYRKEFKINPMLYKLGFKSKCLNIFQWIKTN